MTYQPASKTVSPCSESSQLMTNDKLMDWSREPLPKVAEKVECITSPPSGAG